MSIELQGYLINWRADLLKAAERKRLQGMEALGEAETIEADIDYLDRAIAAHSVPEVAEVEGFVKWEGGPCPVAVGTKVRVRFRADWAGDPETYGPGQCEHVVADEGDTINAESWQHSTSQSRSWGDIIAYRVLPIESAAKWEERPCTCHPDDAPAECQHLYAASACRAAYDATLPTADDVQGILADDVDGFNREGETEAIEAALTHFHGGTSFSDTHTITIASSSQHAEESARAQDLASPLTDEVLEAITELAEAKLAALQLGPDTVAMQTYMDGDQLVVREVTASEFYAQPEVDVTPPAQDLAPLFPPEAPKVATPEELETRGVIDGTASWWARKLSKEPA